MKKEALEFAVTLMKPEYRDLIDSKFRKKIENLVRKSGGVGGKGLDISRSTLTTASSSRSRGFTEDEGGMTMSPPSSLLSETGGPANALSSSPCPFCQANIPDTELSCFSCKNTIPFCIASGLHVTRSSLVFCPECKFPAIKVFLIRYLQSVEPNCPMCSAELSSSPDDIEIPGEGEVNEFFASLKE